MKAVKFPGTNTLYAEHQQEYIPLPSRKSEAGKVTTCWRLSLFERLKVAIFGNVWLEVLTFNQPLQPLRMSADPCKKCRARGRILSFENQAQWIAYKIQLFFQGRKANPELRHISVACPECH